MNWVWSESGLTLSFLGGLLLILLSLTVGRLDVKGVRIPKLIAWGRVLAFVLGLILWYPPLLTLFSTKRPSSGVSVIFRQVGYPQLDESMDLSKTTEMGKSYWPHVQFFVQTGSLEPPVVTYGGSRSYPDGDTITAATATVQNLKGVLIRIDFPRLMSTQEASDNDRWVKVYIAQANMETKEGVVIATKAIYWDSLAPAKDTPRN